MSSDVLQERLNAVLEHGKGVTGIADDCLISGDTQESHDKNLLYLARHNNLKFNPKKLQLKKKYSG